MKIRKILLSHTLTLLVQVPVGAPTIVFRHNLALS